MDLRTAGVVIQILKLMAASDGSIAAEEEELLESLGKQYLKEASVPSLTAAFSNPDDIEALAKEVPEAYKLLTAKLAYMVIASSREAYQFSVNSDEQEAFDRLCSTLMIEEDARIELATEAKNDLSQRPGLWEILYSSFSSQFSMGNTLGSFKRKAF